ncbi:hypothetical protein HAX54_034819 [Datura stramonium]|uniref:Uncharacterized protein n=1 Tax=Datura stramonium TaxID=4076 RepID=A0ABS8VFB2_DATST|nr:hypothetical protein [Datura stramonium]
MAQCRPRKERKTQADLILNKMKQKTPKKEVAKKPKQVWISKKSKEVNQVQNKPSKETSEIGCGDMTQSDWIPVKSKSANRGLLPREEGTGIHNVFNPLEENTIQHLISAAFELGAKGRHQPPFTPT